MTSFRAQKDPRTFLTFWLGELEKGACVCITVTQRLGFLYVLITSLSTPQTLGDILKNNRVQSTLLWLEGARTEHGTPLT